MAVITTPATEGWLTVCYISLVVSLSLCGCEVCDMQQEDSHLAPRIFNIGYMKSENVEVTPIPMTSSGLVPFPPQENWEELAFSRTPSIPSDVPLVCAAPVAPRRYQWPSIKEEDWLPQTLGVSGHCSSELQNYPLLAPYHHRPEELALARVNQPALEDIILDQWPSIKEEDWLPQPLDLSRHCSSQLEENYPLLARYLQRPEKPALARVNEPALEDITSGKELTEQILRGYSGETAVKLKQKKEVDVGVMSTTSSGVVGFPPQENGTASIPSDAPLIRAIPVPPRRYQGPSFKEEVWLPQTLSVSGHCSSELENYPLLAPYHNRPEEPALARVNQPALEDIISDKELMDLSIYNLNRRLKGYSREIVVQLKQKRREMKKMARFIRLRTPKKEIENDLHRTKVELRRMVQVVELLHQQCHVLREERDMNRERYENILQYMPLNYSTVG